MSGLWSKTSLLRDLKNGGPQRNFGFSPEGHGEKSGARRRLGRNEDPYYGPTLDALHAQKHGTKKLSQALAAQGATTEKGRYTSLGGDGKPRKAAKQLLGG